MVHLPNFPEKDELEYKEAELRLSIYEQFQRSAKAWFYALLVVVVLAIPAKILLQNGLSKSFIGSYHPPVLVTDPFNPPPIKILKTGILPIQPRVVSAYAQISNPNPDFSSQKFSYTFVFKGLDGKVLKEFPGESYLLAGESKYLIIPSAVLPADPGSFDLVLTNVRWTQRTPPFNVKLDILQQNQGVTPEGKFFVEGLLRNLRTFHIKRVDIAFIAFDKSNQNVIGANSTYYTDLLPLESRYFKVLWPSSQLASGGTVMVFPYVNLLQPGLVLDQSGKIPLR